MNDKTRKILMGLGVVLTTGLMLTLYFVDWAMFGSHSDAEGQEMHEKFQNHVSAQSLDIKDHADYARKMATFIDRDQKIMEHNREYAQGKYKFTMVHNKFSTMNRTEMNKYKMAKGMYPENVPMSLEEVKKLPKVVGADDLPEEVNWITKGAVNPIKNQAQCGSCYSFGSTAVVEASIFIGGRDLPNLSEQQIVSCSQQFGNLGCYGGHQYWVFEYLKDNHQVEYETYPYSSETANWFNTHSQYYNQGETEAPACDKTKEKGGQYKVTSHAQVTAESASALKKAISEGVVTVTVDASYFSSPKMMHYGSGIFDDAKACGTSLDHAIAAVGYGKDSKGTEYYIIRNSWGTDWGDEGYIKFEITGDGPGMCGVQLAAYTANAEYVPVSAVEESSNINGIKTELGDDFSMIHYKPEQSYIDGKLQPDKHYLFKNDKPVSVWHDLKLYPEESDPEIIQGVIEIPKDTTPKYEVNSFEPWNPIIQDTTTDKSTGKKVLRDYGIKTIFNYGMIPQTWENSKAKDPKTGLFGDNDPLDLVDLTDRQMGMFERPHLKVLGALCLEDEGELDWKIFAIETSFAKQNNIQSLESYEQFKPGHLAEVKEWFKMYKTYKGKPENKFCYEGRILDHEETMVVIHENHEEYKQLAERLANDDCPNCDDKFWFNFDSKYLQKKE